MADDEKDMKSAADMDQDYGEMNNGTIGGNMGIMERSSSKDGVGNTSNSGSGGTMDGDTGGGTGSSSGTEGSASNAGGNAAGSAAGDS